ncbi:alkaline phosphatase family protein [Algibacter sp. PT7-4]|uniref:alkaline phosphatase family protein n=1 Tax=Algibacter ulvanivorans TaxID=3400999 RepID=UPI003AAFAD1E
MKLQLKFGGKIKMKHNNKLIAGIITGIVISLWSCAFNAEKVSRSPKGIEHVIVIGVDGMSPDGITKAKTPTLDSMIANGAATLHARSVLPSSSSPNWASMLMGADTEQHGITSNGWKKNDHILPSVVETNNGTFPTIFTLFKDQEPESNVGAIYDWDDFGRLFEKNEVGFDINGDHEDGTTNDAITYIEAHAPKFAFIHLDHVDHAGHSMGHGSKAYYKSIEKADSLITQIIEATKRKGIFNKTMFIIAADHGGLGYSHGGESLAEVEVPFILYGAGIKKGYKIEEAVYQYDNAATVAYAFNLKIPQAWIGRPVKGAFLGNPKPELIYKRVKRTVAPKILPNAGYFEAAGGVFKADSVAVVIQNPNSKGEIRYTLDNEVLTLENSKVYKDTFYVKQTRIIKAAVFKNDNIKSTVALGNFRLASKTKKNPVKYQVFYGENMEKLPDFSKIKPVKTGYTTEFSHKNVIVDGVKNDQVAVVYESYLEIDNTGKYTFFVNSDDGSKLYINNQLIADNDGDHGVLEKNGSINLQKGRHLIRVAFFNGGGGFHLDAKYESENMLKQIIPINKLFATQS